MAGINIKIGTISTKFHYPYEGIFGKASPGPTYIIKEVTGNGYVNLTNAVANHLMELKAYGGTEQNGTPAPDSPVDIVCNNGTLKFSKNMANVNVQTALVGYYISAQGNVLESPYNRIYQEYIPCKPNTKYTLSMSDAVYFISISEYSTVEDSGFVRRDAGGTGGNTKLTITTRSNTNYLRFGANLTSSDITIDDVLAINWQLEEGDTATPYHEYVEGGIYIDGTTEILSNTLSTATAEMLLKIGDYVDEQEILSGDITRKVGIKVLDGTETRGEKDQYGRVQLTVSDLPSGDITRKMAAYCTHFKNLHNSEPIGNVVPGQFYLGNPKSFYFHILENDVAGFKTWLASQYNAGTPVIVVYPLATPTTESVAGQTMHIPSGNSTIEITQASINNLGLYAKYKATE